MSGAGVSAVVCVLFALLTTWCTPPVAARTFPPYRSQSTPPSSYRDSLTMDVLRRGRVSIGYLFYYPNAVAANDRTASNPTLMARLDELFDVALHDTLINFDHAELLGSASIEGTLHSNETLARDRAYSMYRFLEERYHLSDYLITEVRWIAEDWDGLAACVRQTSVREFPWRSEVLSIISSVPVTNGRETLLMKLDGGRPYNYMLKHFFPYQRRAVITLTCDLQRLAEKRLNRELNSDEVERVVATALLPTRVAETFLADKSIASRPIALPHTGTLREQIARALDKLRDPLQTMTTVVRHDTITIVHETTQIDTLIVSEDKPVPYHFVVKTNLLFDAALLPNLALEFPLPGGWSVEAEAQWAWWNTHDSRRYFYRIQSLGLEARRWWGNPREQPLNGHYLGVYLLGGTYDVRLGKEKGYQSDFSFSAGVSYGYSFHLSQRWNLELGISAGYLGGKYYRYHFDPVYDRYPWESTHRLYYFGLTKAKVSLVYRIGAME
jgi:hypothetical protein